MIEQQLTVFKAVAETSNITLAAKKLHMSQPSISLQIQNLENQYGAKFFDRTNKGVSLTKAGEVFYSHTLRILDMLDNLKTEVNSLVEDQRGLVYLGATLTIGEYIMPNILAYLVKVRPDIDVKLKIANTETISQDILEKNIHFGLVEGPVPRHKELVTEKFWEDELSVIVPIIHPLAQRETITFAELKQERIIMREEGSGTRKVTELALQEKGFDPSQLNITMELGSTQAIKQVVAAGLGISIISSLTVKRECDQKLLKALRIKDSPVKRDLNILINAQTEQTRDERYLYNLMHNKDILNAVLQMDYCQIMDLDVKGTLDAC